LRRKRGDGTVKKKKKGKKEKRHPNSLGRKDTARTAEHVKTPVVGELRRTYNWKKKKKKKKNPPTSGEAQVLQDHDNARKQKLKTRAHKQDERRFWQKKGAWKGCGFL